MTYVRLLNIQGLCVYFKVKESTLELEDVLTYVDRCIFEYASRHLNDIERGIIRWTYEGLSYKNMAARMDYSPNTMRAVYGYEFWQLLKRVWPDENVTKTNFIEIVERLHQEEQDLQRDATQPNSQLSSQDLDLSIGATDGFDNQPAKSPLLRLVDALTSGRKAIILTGARGIGKSYLLENSVLELNGHFAKIVYHPTYEIPTWQTWHKNLSSMGLIDFVNSSENSIPLTTYQIRQQVLQTLNQNRYLLIVEQGERFIDNPDYNNFFQEIATAINNQSCLLWVSAIRPVAIDRRVAVETVNGFSFDEASVLLQKEYPYLSDSLSQNEIHWKQLVKLCGGNPDLLHKSVETLKSFYANQIEQFTAHLSSLPLSYRHFENLIDELSEAEQKLLYLFAFRPLSWIDVQDWALVTAHEQGQLTQAWDKLHRRHILEHYSETDGICQITPPYLGLYLLQRLRDIFLHELSMENLTLLHSYPLSLPTAFVEQQKILKNYLLVPIANTLKYRFSSEDLHAKFDRLLSQLATVPVPSRSYAAGSLFNLAAHMGLSLTDMSWANLTLWHADLRVSGLQGLDFQSCQFREAVLITGVHESFAIALHPKRTAMAIGDSQGFLQVYQWLNNRFVLAWCDDLGIPIQQVVITNSDTLIVVLSDQSTLIWDNLTHKEQFYSDISVSAAICSIDLKDNLLAIGLSNREIQLWNLILGEEIGEPLCDANNIVRHLTFSPDGKNLAGYDNNNSILIWHRSVSDNTYAAAEISFPLARYGHFLAFQWMGTQLNVVEATPGDDSQESLSRVMVRSFTVTDKTLAEDSIDFNVRELETSSSQPCRATFSGNGKYLVVCDIDHTVRIWNEMMPSSTLITLPELPENLFISDDGRQLLCQNASSISVWDLESQEILQTWETVSDLDQYQNCKFYTEQGFSNDELSVVQRLGGLLV
ncbi:MAG: WD40 repeat domain-containing protein [Cyanobacteria bacterium P01_F01_bin.13]